MSANARTHERPEAFAWMALAAALFAVMNLFARLSSTDAHWTVVAAGRALVGAVVAMGIAHARGVPAFVRPSRAMWLRSTFGTVAMGCSFYALTSRYIPLADAVTLNNMTPLILAVLAPFVLGERGGRRVLIAVPAAMVGVIMVVRPPFFFGDAERSAYFADATGQVSYHAGLLPAAVALSGALFSALAMMSLRTASMHEPPEAVATHFSLMAFVVYAVAALLLARPPSVGALLPVALAGAFAGGAQVAMTRSYRLEQAARVGGVGYLQVVVGAGLGAWVLHEPLPTRALVGIALVVSSGALLTVMSFADARRAARLGHR